MSAALAELLTDRAKWSRQSAAGVARARTLFNIDDVVSRYEEVYRSVL